MMSLYVDPVLYAVALITVLIIFLPYSPMTIDIINLSRDTQLKVYLNRHFLWTIAAVCFAIVLGRAIMGLADPVWIKTSLITIGVLAFMFWSGYVPYVMTPPANPRLLSTEEADEVIGDDEIVIGLAHGGEVRAYSRDTISRPHFYSDTVAGTPLTVSYCILCNSGMAFKNELNNKPMNLACVTAFNNNIIYRDAKSGNYIQQLDGKVILGPDEGEQLDFLPTVMASWAQWKKLHPDTKLYYAPAKTLRDKMVGLMLSMMIPIHKLAARSKPWHRIQGELDTRLPAMSFVYGVELDGDTCAYPVATLSEHPICNDKLGGQPIVVVYDQKRDIGAVYSRTIGGAQLDFEPAPGDASAPGAIAIDKQSGSQWDVTGAAVSGSYAGQRLEAIPHYNKIFWFSWALFKNGTKVSMAT